MGNSTFLFVSYSSTLKTLFGRKLSSIRITVIKSNALEVIFFVDISRVADPGFWSAPDPALV